VSPTLKASTTPGRAFIMVHLTGLVRERRGWCNVKKPVWP